MGCQLHGLPRVPVACSHVGLPLKTDNCRNRNRVRCSVLWREKKICAQRNSLYASIQGHKCVHLAAHPCQVGRVATHLSAYPRAGLNRRQSMITCATNRKPAQQAKGAGYILNRFLFLGVVLNTRALRFAPSPSAIRTGFVHSITSKFHHRLISVCDVCRPKPKELPSLWFSLFSAGLVKTN